MTNGDYLEIREWARRWMMKNDPAYRGCRPDERPAAKPADDHLPAGSCSDCDIVDDVSHNSRAAIRQQDRPPS
jgi:hypothetical protein